MIIAPERLLLQRHCEKNPFWLASLAPEPRHPLTLPILLFFWAAEGSRVALVASRSCEEEQSAHLLHRRHSQQCSQPRDAAAARLFAPVSAPILSRLATLRATRHRRNPGGAAPSPLDSSQTEALCAKRVSNLLACVFQNVVSCNAFTKNHLHDLSQIASQLGSPPRPCLLVSRTQHGRN